MKSNQKNNLTVRMDGQISGSNSNETIKMGGGRDHSFLFSFYKTLDIERITFFNSDTSITFFLLFFIDFQETINSTEEFKILFFILL